MICPSAMKAEGNTITIINCDKVNIRNEAGQSLGRVGCYTPVTVGETKDDSTYVTISRAFLEIYQQEYGLIEYFNFYSGDISGWVKTRCLSEVKEDMDRVIYKAEEYRWEYWVDGIYHEIKSDSVVKNKCYEMHYSPIVNNTFLGAHAKLKDMMNKGSTYSSAANVEWREAYYYFIVEEQFRSFGYNAREKDAYLDNRYYLYDLTSDGIPELIMDTCWNDGVGGANVFFTYSAEKGITEIGIGPFQWGNYFYGDNNRYNGLFYEHVSRGVHGVTYWYYSKDTHKIELESVWSNYDEHQGPPYMGDNQLTDDDGLYYFFKHLNRKELYPIARSEMPNLDGWNAFLKSYGY